jgi:magnesium-protoporphyrin IX monomethyl ester (oxidative) cyclase
VLDQVNLSDYDTVGLSTMSNSFHHSLNILAAIKAQKPDMHIWLGGPHVSVIAKKVIEVFESIEAIFVGESEETFEAAMNRYLQKNFNLGGIPGIQTRGGRFTPRAPIQNLDNLPPIYLSKDYLAGLSHNYEIHGEKGAPLEVTRGCPGICSFCSTRLFWGSAIRRKSDQRIFTEMQRINQISKLTHFNFYGDNFGFPRSCLINFCNKMIKNNLDYLWYCDLRLNDLRPEDLDLLWSAGCRGFLTGIESGSQKTQKYINKNVRLDHAFELIAKSIDKGFAVKTSFIIGFPWETMDDINKTFDYHCNMLKLGVKSSDINVVIPLLGTPLTDKFRVLLDCDEYLNHDSIDNIPLDKATRDLIKLHPEMFLQFGYFENPNIDKLDILAMVDAARQIKTIYLDSGKH